MKIYYVVPILIMAIYSQLCLTCPTCVGKASKQSAPFFSDECYRTSETIGSSEQPIHDNQLEQSSTPTQPLIDQGE